MYNEELISVKEVAELLHMNERHVREAIENGSFEFGRCFKTGKSKVYKISRRAFMRWFCGETQEVG